MGRKGDAEARRRRQQRQQPLDEPDPLREIGRRVLDDDLHALNERRQQRLDHVEAVVRGGHQAEHRRFLLCRVGRAICASCSSGIVLPTISKIGICGSINWLSACKLPPSARSTSAGSKDDVAHRLSATADLRLYHQEGDRRPAHQPHAATAAPGHRRNARFLQRLGDVIRLHAGRRCQKSQFSLRFSLIE